MSVETYTIENFRGLNLSYNVDEVSITNVKGDTIYHVFDNMKDIDIYYISQIAYDLLEYLSKTNVNKYTSENIRNGIKHSSENFKLFLKRKLKDLN